MSEIHIAREFTAVPGPRYQDQGEGSGEEFRERYLLPAFRRVLGSEKVVVHLDGVKYGYPTSFLEEAFGGLVRKLGVEVVKETLDLRSAEPPLLLEIRHYIEHANDGLRDATHPGGARRASSRTVDRR